ncbi:uncharacterized protein LOC117509717 [Thalassophryne amazonica]|uniref:uncharacterized protein LOC117509717 n=1 Tax=Thalassophryne amazonica TaxID=390379 RepID=UPI001470CEFE|nr:uncharacterized protein LOC117509717 [Thalassophryne amazonica]
MSYSNQSQINVFAGLQGDLLVEYVLFTVLCSLPCCLFLFINGMMLFTLRSKAVFRETPRYILLYNVLLADTALLAQSQLLYALAASGLRLTYPVCGVLTMLTTLSNEISPLTLMVMSLERCLSVLIYGLKDQTIRPVLMFYLCCCLQRAKPRHSNKQENKGENEKRARVTPSEKDPVITPKGKEFTGTVREVIENLPSRDRMNAEYIMRKVSTARHSRRGDSVSGSCGAYQAYKLSKRIRGSESKCGDADWCHVQFFPPYNSFRLA